jgi:hypothetical protein
MKYQEAEICKRESEVIKFIQTGSNNFWESYYNYESRKRRLNRPTWTIATWFNKTVKGLHKKQLFLSVPFVYHSAAAQWANLNGFIWINPLINSSKANFECFTLHDAVMDQKREINKII